MAREMAPRPSSVLAAALVMASIICASGAIIRGLDPAMAASYQPIEGNLFRCLDGKKTLPYDQLNDDFCDCFDGSDEPGESAAVPHKRLPLLPPSTAHCC